MKVITINNGAIQRSPGFVAPYRDKTGANFNFKFVNSMANLNKIRSNAKGVALFVVQFMAVAAVFLILYFFLILGYGLGFDM